MDRSYSSIRHHHHHHRHRRENPSFSSSLLDSIYRSIEGEEASTEIERERELIFYRETMRRKPHTNSSVAAPPEEDFSAASFRRSSMIEKWMEKKAAEKVAAVRRSSVADFEAHRRRSMMNSSSTSSESSSGGSGFSSSESEKPHHRRPKPIRTSVSAPPPENPKQSKRESGFVKTKSKALKIYGDLKKVKQPISPGGKLASFLNSLFKPTPKPNSSANSATACSSASSFSRSCLSNTPSSRGKFSDASANKRSVRFCPVSVIVDEDCRTIGHKSLNRQITDGDDRRRVQEVAIDLLKSYQKKSSNDVVTDRDFDMRDVVDVVRIRKNDANRYRNDDDDDDDNDDDDDDAASYSSSDLFELDNLSAIGIERYHEELPVYETTHFDTNRAIANGLIL